MVSVRIDLPRTLAMFASTYFIGCAAHAPRSQSSSPADTRVVLFVCEHGVAKSALAAVLFNEMAKARGMSMRAERRAASTPQIEPSLSTNKGLAADGFPAPEGVPLQISEHDINSALRVVTLGTSLPFKVDGRPVEDWADVPAVGDNYPNARDSIRNHISRLLADLIAELTANPHGN